MRLYRNSLSGRLPDSLWSLQKLQVLDLSSNNFSGALPDSVPDNAGGGGGGAGVFNLSNNLYYGTVPSGFTRFVLARFSAVDLSDNYFQGPVPVDGGAENVSVGLNCFRDASQQRSSTKCQEFYSARGLPYDGPSSPSPSSPPHKKSTWKWIVIGVVGGVVVLLLVVAAVVLCIVKCRGGARDVEQRGTSMDVSPVGTGTVTQDLPSGVSLSGVLPSGVAVSLSAVGEGFTFEQLVRATAEFSDRNLIRHGHSGDLYHGVLEGGIQVVVKRVDLERVKKTGYTVELEIFSKVSHTRIVPFLGHCLDKESEKFLVYKYMPHGDLLNALYVKSPHEEEGLQSLDWITRLKIATGVAEALCYLHHECTPPLVHRYCPIP